MLLMVGLTVSLGTVNYRHAEVLRVFRSIYTQAVKQTGLLESGLSDLQQSIRKDLVSLCAMSGIAGALITLVVIAGVAFFLYK